MKNCVIVFISFITLFLISIDITAEELSSDMCGYNLVEFSSIIVEDNNKCFKYIKPEKEKKDKKLMIVAHPDDETIFGGSHLLNDDYTVVCVTCGVVDYRVKEFEEVMKQTNDDYIMLSFTDRVDKTGPISNWENEYDDIYAALSKIINEENWTSIVTHNPDGEYGHIHHIMTSEMITDIVKDDRLNYFGRWYHDGSGEQTIDNESYNKKMNNLISIYYGSQHSAIDYNYNMLPYENWIKASEW